MSDNKNTTDGRDRSKVDSRDASEVEYLHSQFPGLSHEQIKAAIEAAGPSREAVKQYIQEKHGV